MIAEISNPDGTTVSTYAVGSYPVALAVGDVTGDGVADIVTANYWSADVTILRGLGDGLFESSNTIRLDFRPDAIEIRDFDGDGLLDLRVLSYTPDQEHTL